MGLININFQDQSFILKISLSLPIEASVKKDCLELS